MSNTDSLDAVTKQIITVLKTNIALLVSTDVGDDGRIASVADAAEVIGYPPIYYGDQDKLPVTPCICVEPSNRLREYHQVSYRTTNSFSVYLLFYHSRVQDNQVTRAQIQQISEAAETLIHQDPQLAGLVIDGFCSNNESGYVYRQGTMYRTNRVLYEATTKTRLR